MIVSIRIFPCNVSDRSKLWIFLNSKNGILVFPILASCPPVNHFYSILFTDILSIAHVLLFVFIY